MFYDSHLIAWMLRLKPNMGGGEWMTYLELYLKAEHKLSRNEITLGEFVKMIEPLNAEITQLPQGIILCRECGYGRRDNKGRWYCDDVGCQIGPEDGSGFCANAQRRV